MTAVRDGRPPSASEIPIATGAVTDFGASEARVSRDAPDSAAMPIADNAATSDPLIRLTESASAERRTLSICL